MSLRDSGYAIIACLLWSTAFVGVKAGLEYMSPLTLAGVRFLLAGVILLPFGGGISALGRVFVLHRRTLVAASLLNTVGLYALFFFAIQFVRGAQAAILIGASPLISATVAHFVIDDDRMTRSKIISILFGLSGVVLLAVAGKPWEPVGARESGGLLILFCASVVGAFGNVAVVRGRSVTLHPVALASLQMLIGGVVLLVMGLILEGVPCKALTLHFYLVLGWLAFISAAAFAIWFHLLQRVSVSELNLWKFLIPLSGAALSWILIKGEQPDVLSLVGMGFVVGGIIWSQRVSSI
ncbi:MAG: hypothetical protein DRI57_28370 [Deltaproteobacteria bacterium]|nr:MAG: hypothetical protein DRI57_28370 [Deltaproteobacteria bacterium]